MKNQRIYGKFEVCINNRHLYKKPTFLSNFKGEHPCFCLYSLCFLSASSSKSSSSSDEDDDDEDDFVLWLDFWNDDLDEG